MSAPRSEFDRIRPLMTNEDEVDEDGMIEEDKEEVNKVHLKCQQQNK